MFQKEILSEILILVIPILQRKKTSFPVLYMFESTLWYLNYWFRIFSALKYYVCTHRLVGKKIHFGNIMCQFYFLNPICVTHTVLCLVYRDSFVFVCVHMYTALSHYFLWIFRHMRIYIFYSFVDIFFNICVCDSIYYR